MSSTKGRKIKVHAQNKNGDPWCRPATFAATTDDMTKVTCAVCKPYAITRLNDATQK